MSATFLLFQTKEAVKQLTLALTHGIVAQSTELQIPSKDRQTKSDEEEELVQNQVDDYIDNLPD